MDKKCNNGVCCDVCDCEHNERGCDCNLDKIRVSAGGDNTHHFCKSYKCRNMSGLERNILEDTNNANI